MHPVYGKLINNTWTLIEIDDLIKEDSKRLKEVEDDLTSSKEQRWLYRDRLESLNTERQARLEFLSQNWRDFQTQVARTKQIIKKVLDKDESLVEGISTFFCEHGITIFSILPTLSMTISITVGSPAASGLSSPMD